MNRQRSILVCFAVWEEAAFFRPQAGSGPRVRTLLTGMGGRNAGEKLRATLSGMNPGLVLTCGFAGGLRPDLASGTVLFSAQSAPELGAALAAAGATAGRFHCSDRVATSVREKTELHDATGADAVEMESEAIEAICRQQGILSATVRVILDPAGEDLPLDFNRLMNAQQQMDYLKLAWALARSPGKIAALLRLRKQSRSAAEQLGTVLTEALGRWGGGTAG